MIRLDFYRDIQNLVVPLELRMAGIILLDFGLEPQVFGECLIVGLENLTLIEIVWKRVGW